MTVMEYMNAHREDMSYPICLYALSLFRNRSLPISRNWKRSPAKIN